MSPLPASGPGAQAPDRSRSGPHAGPPFCVRASPRRRRAIARPEGFPVVSEPIEPVGAVAEPYALWAIERQPDLVVPCSHPAIVLTDTLAHHERPKLFERRVGGLLALAAAQAPGLAQPKLRALADQNGESGK